MSTRSIIGLMCDDGSIIGCYHHYDGYIQDGVGEMLYREYPTIDVASEGINTGFDESEEFDGVNFYDNEKDFHYLTLQSGVDYVYLFKNGEWWYAKHHFYPDWEERKKNHQSIKYCDEMKKLRHFFEKPETTLKTE